MPKYANVICENFLIAQECNVRQKASLWFAQIEDIAGVSYEELGNPGLIFEQYDFTVSVATMHACKGHLHKRLLRTEEEAHKRHVILTGRQMLRMVLENYQTDPVAKQMFNIGHLHELTYLGDDRLSDFLDAWWRLLGDQEEALSDRQKELIFYNKIKGSTVLKGYLDYYNRLPDNAAERSYQYLIDSVETYLRRSQLNSNLTNLTSSITQNLTNLGKKKKWKFYQENV
mgnify:CR=1 FL=1